jgi:S-adenosylmethionine:tRNA ribosyltransferase-isomerase
MPGDLIVVNDTKVIAARLTGRKRPGGGRVTLLLIRALTNATWEVLCQGRVRVGQVIELGQDAIITVLSRGQARTTVSLKSDLPMEMLLGKYGQMPLPPYMKRDPVDDDRRWYQTVFAKDEGSIAAPTAGLHFTDGLLTKLQSRGIEQLSLTLHVGWSTFRSVTVERIQDHEMLPETFNIPESTALAVERTKKAGRRVLAVGTTVVRALETAADPAGFVRPMTGETKLFVFPGYQFKVVDALMTNFHFPRTTLAMLVAAFVGRESLREIYAEAVRERYRFYSYGDAMLIL